MTAMSTDTQDMSAPNFYESRLTANPQPIPKICPIGDRTSIEEADEETLRAKFEEYAGAATILVENFDFERDRFDEAYEDYIRIFASIETLESINRTAEAIAPGYDLLEEFELISLPGAAAEAGAVIGKITLYGGGVAALGGLAKAARDWRTAAKTLKAANGKPIGASRPSEIIKKAKWTKRMKILGGLGAALTVGSATIGIIAAIENNKRRIAFLQDSVESYQNWYADIAQDIEEFQSGSSQMETAIDELMTLLGYGTPDELIAFLQGSVQVAGEVQAGLRTATRMLCATDPLPASQIALLVGLPLVTISRRELLIQANPDLCMMDG